MNNKGFTLIELLVVIVILIAIVSLAIPSITSTIERQKTKINNSKLELLASAAELYLNDNDRAKISEFNSGGCYVNLGDLKDEGYIDEDDMKDADDNSIGNYIYYDGTQYKTTSSTTITKCY